VEELPHDYEFTVADYTILKREISLSAVIIK
jgi:hypothetical protein